MNSNYLTKSFNNYTILQGDQASIIGGAIEFVRELEQLLQCLESQKRRRLLGEPPLQAAADPSPATSQQQPPFLQSEAEAAVGNFPAQQQNDGQMFETTAESKSCVADVEVKVLGLDGMIKILSRRRPGQLIKAIAALEDLQLSILHTNITTIEQTVLYSFNVKVRDLIFIISSDFCLILISYFPLLLLKRNSNLKR